MSTGSAAEIIRDAWRQGRPIVPFIGAGVSVAAGYPNISRLTGYLAKVQFALEKELYKTRYPLISDGIDTAAQRYIRHPSEFIADFGWPDIGQLNSDLWSWISDKGGIFQDQHSAVQSILLQRLKSAEPDLTGSLKRLKRPPRISGDWSSLLNGISEGQFDLIDSLFTGLDKGRTPTRAHMFLAFLTQALGVRLLMTTNFDSLLESAMRREGLTPKIFDVHRDADLPHARLVRSQFSVVKLAGSAYGLRFGERLQYALEDESRKKIHGYLPDNALLVVMGFSGWERRMMEVIGDFARRQAGSSGQTQVLWLTDVPETGPHSEMLMRLEKELRDSGKDFAVKRHTICDVNSFLPGLYFNITSGFPASQQRYEALASCLPRPVDKDKDFKKELCTAVVVFSDIDSLKPESIAFCPTSWPSLAAAHYTYMYRGERHILWIDLENHYTVESVVQDILSQIRRVDPGAPRLILSSEPLKPFSKHDLVKTVERLREALLRGSYLIAFDSLESFGRPQFLHHGLRRIQKIDDPTTERLYAFISLLLGLQQISPPAGRAGELPIHPPLYDTIVLIAVTQPSLRRQGGTPKLLQQLITNLQGFITSLKMADPIRTTRKVGGESVVISEKQVVPVSYSRNDTPAMSCTKVTALHDKASENVRNHVSTLNRNPPLNEWCRFAVDIVRLRQILSDPMSEVPISAEVEMIGKVLPLLSLLSFFRRPRPVALLRAVLLRWIFDPGDLAHPGQMTSALKSIDDALSCMERMNLVTLLEGNTVWIPRQIHEPLYCQITSILKLSDKQEHLSDQEGHSAAAVLLSSLICSAWHLQLARAYFADVYLATHDEQAFFEYMYHRVAGLRYSLLAQVVCSSSINKEAVMTSLEATLECFKGEYEWSSIFRDPTKNDSSTKTPDNIQVVHKLLTEAGCPNVAELFSSLGVFASVRRDRDLSHSLKISSPVTAIVVIQIVVAHMRRHSLETLANAFTREHEKISATTTPDTWLGWIKQLLETEIPQVSGKHLTSSFPDYDVREITSIGAFEDAQGRLRFSLIELRLRLLRQKLDFSLARRTAAAEIGDLIQDNGALSSRLEECEDDEIPDVINIAWEKSCIAGPKGDGAWLHLLRCWIELARAVEGQGCDKRSVNNATLILEKVIESAHARQEGQQGRASHVSAERVLHDARKVRTQIMLHESPMWHTFDVEVPSGRHQKGFARLRDVERSTHELEDDIRVSAPSSIEYAIRRSIVYSMRARALYLRGQFREAHRVLSLSLNDVHDHVGDGRFARAVAYVYRAELHALSADAHLPGSGTLSGGTLMSSARKLETAIECLDMAAQSLDPAAHRALWWLRIHLGRAQIRHEQLLLTIRQLSSTEIPAPLSYAQLSLWLEECVLDGLRSIRVALDTLPFRKEKYRETVKDKDSLVEVEEKLLALWLQTFVASFACNHLMLARLQMPRVSPPQSLLTGWSEYFSWTGNAVSELLKNRVTPLYELFSPRGFLREKWSPWCRSRQFYYFQKTMASPTDPLMGMVDECLRDVRNVNRSSHISNPFGFREEILNVESALIKDNKSFVLGHLWDWRREECDVSIRSCTPSANPRRG